MADRKHVAGKFSWFELVGPDPKKAQAFYAELLGWMAVSFPVGGASYDMIFAGETPDTMIGSYTSRRDDGRGARWVASVSVGDVDAAAATARAQGAQILEPPYDLPRVGRAARILDPDGAEFALFKSSTGDPPDAGDALSARFFWNELHTHSPERALAFYEKVVGFAHRAIPMGSAGTYYVVAKGGVDRGGVTNHLPAGVSAHWLPYVKVNDVDAAFVCARRLGATVVVAPEDIAGIGRYGVLQDPTGALVALMKPLPRQAE